MIKDYGQYRQAIHALFQGKNGQAILEHFRNLYINRSIMGENTDLVMYNLGQKEFVEALIQDATTEYVPQQETEEE